MFNPKKVAMKKILIKDIIGTSNAIIQKFGLEVFREIKDLIGAETQVLLSFEGLTNVTSGFCHASIGNIYQAFPDKADKFLFIDGIDKNLIWQEKVKDAITLATNPIKSKELDSAISELFA